MNRSFENIFEKYNLRNETPRKRRRNIKSQLCKKGLPISTRIEAGNSKSCSLPITKDLTFSPNFCLNKNSKAKYYLPTRYRRLDIIKVGSEAYSSAERIQLDNNVRSKENRKEFSSNVARKQTNDDRKNCDTLETVNGSQNKAALISIENINNAKLNNITDCSDISDTSEVNEINFMITESSFTKSSVYGSIEDISLESARNDATSTELDLLIDLVEQEGHINKKDINIDKHNGKIANCDEQRLLATKPMLKGGYQEMFERCLKDAKVKSNFLKYDKKLGLRVGHLLTVVKIETFYGFNLATVKNQALNKNFALAVTREMSQHLKSGSRIEAFFDDTTLPYKLVLNGEYFDVYLEPYKLLIE